MGNNLGRNFPTFDRYDDGGEAVSIKSLDDSGLAVTLPTAPSATPHVVFIRDVFAASSAADGVLEPCPPPASACAQLSPTFDADDHLLYLAAFDPDPEHPCSLTPCQYQTYDATRLSGGSARSILQLRGAADSNPTLSASGSGNALLVTLTDQNGTLTTYRWSMGTTVALSHAADDAQW